MCKKIFIIVAASIFFMLFFLTNSNLYAKAKELKLGFVTSASETDPYNITAEKFSELIEKYTDNQYTVDIYPSAQLGNERDMIKNLSMGTMDFGVITNAPVGSSVNAFMVLDLPFIFEDRETAHAVLDGEAGKMLLDKLETINIKGLAFSEGGFRHMINNVKPIKKPEDTEDIKFRVMKTPIYIEMFKALGSNAVPMPWDEVFTATQQKVIDGLEIPISVIHGNKFYEVTKYLSLTGHTYSPLVIMCSETTWNQFSQNEQVQIQKAAQEAAEYERSELKDIIEEFLKELEDKGMEINDVPDKEPFQEAVQPVYEEFEDKIGKGVLEKVLEASKNSSN